MLDQELSDPAALKEKHVVLLVDDEPSILSSLYRSLREEPYEILTAESAEHALEILGCLKVSLLVTDQRMPGMCGADLFEEVRRRFPATKRLMLTGYPGNARVNYGLARKEIEWLISKPWNDEALRLTIRQLLHEVESEPQADEDNKAKPRALGRARKLIQDANPERQRRLSAELGREILERRHVEDELREVNLILQNAVEGISRLDAEGRYLTVNHAYADLLGTAPEELLGREWVDSFHPEDRPALVASLGQMKEAGKAEVEARGLRKDGSSVPIHLLMIRAQDKEGNLVGHYGFLKDQSERKRAEEERDRLGAQLLQGQKLQAIGQLAAGIAHEINNPVGYILSNLSTLVDYGRDVSGLLRAACAFSDRAASGQDFLKEAEEFERLRRDIDADFLAGDFEAAIVQSRQGAERIRDIVKSLKDFAHAEEGERKPVNLQECLEGALRLCANELKYKATVEREFSDVPPVWGTPLGLEQVFMNLLVNAAQAIPKKGEIHLSLKKEGEEAVIRVRDTGCGIPPENQKRLFEPFFTTKPVGKGTGLGLHVAYKIVRAHHGRIEIVSEVGRGTEFTVRLPLAGSGPGGA